MVASTANVAALDLLRWIPLIPLCASVFNVFFGRRLGSKTAGGIASAAVGVSFGLALYAFWQLPATGIFRDLWYTWIDSGSFHVNIAFQVDALSAIMILVVTGIGFLIHIYSLGYMADDDGMARFFIYLNLFIFFMLLLVMGDNLLLLFVGWEGVGLCSYLLIGFWYQDHKNVIAGNKAFIVNRIGDFGFILGIFLLVTELGRQGIWTLDFAELQKHVQMITPVEMMASSGDPRAHDHLRSAAERTDLNEEARVAAINGLAGSYATSKDAEYLRGLYPRVSSDRLRDAIMSGVATIGGKASRDWVVSIARDPNAHVQQRKRAITMADRLGLSAAELGSMYDTIEDGEVRATLIAQLATNGTKVATDKLVAIARNDPLISNRRRAIQALGKFDDPRVKEALRELVGTSRG